MCWRISWGDAGSINVDDHSHSLAARRSPFPVQSAGGQRQPQPVIAIRFVPQVVGQTDQIER